MNNEENVIGKVMIYPLLFSILILRLVYRVKKRINKRRIGNLPL
jgi:hypothetical protein